MATASDAVRIQGLAEFTARVKALQVAVPTRVVRLALNESATIVAAAARGRAPVRSGRARASVRASSTASSARVSGGGARVKYFGFIDYGGKVGIKRSVSRPFVKTGRILYPAFEARRPEVVAELDKALVSAARNVGLVVESGR